MDFNFDQWMSYSQLNPGEIDRRQKRMTQEYLTQASANSTIPLRMTHEPPVDPKMVAVIDILAARIDTLDSMLKHSLPTIMQTTK